MDILHTPDKNFAKTLMNKDQIHFSCHLADTFNEDFPAVVLDC